VVTLFLQILHTIAHGVVTPFAVMLHLGASRPRALSFASC
jgi:hypothetical protein